MAVPISSLRLNQYARDRKPNMPKATSPVQVLFKSPLLLLTTDRESVVITELTEYLSHCYEKLFIPYTIEKSADREGLSQPTVNVSQCPHWPFPCSVSLLKDHSNALPCLSVTVFTIAWPKHWQIDIGMINQYIRYIKKRRCKLYYSYDTDIRYTNKNN